MSSYIVGILSCFVCMLAYSCWYLCKVVSALWMVWEDTTFHQFHRNSIGGIHVPLLSMFVGHCWNGDCMDETRISSVLFKLQLLRNGNLCTCIAQD